MTTSIEIWDEGFNIFEVQQTMDIVTTHTNISVDVTGTPFISNEYVGYSIKFTDGALDDNGYVITGNDTNTITCSAADFSTLSNGETFKIILTGKDLNNIGAPISEISLITEIIQTLTQSYNYGWDDLFIFGEDPPITGYYIIQGNVKDNKGYNINGVNIIFIDGTSYEIITDSDGNYSQEVDPDEYNVAASLIGYLPDSADVDASSFDQTQDFVLDRTTVRDKGIHLGSRYLLGDIVDN